MFENKSSAKGTITLTEDVVGTIAGIAANGISGVAGMSGTLMNGLAEILGKKSPVKGIKVEADNGEVVANLQIVAEYGVSMPEVCEKIQDNVKNDIERMTGLKVKAVNIHIQAIKIEKEETTEKEIAVNNKPA